MEELKEKNEYYRKAIRKLIDETNNTHALCCTYTVILTHLCILESKGDKTCLQSTIRNRHLTCLPN